MNRLRILLLLGLLFCPCLLQCTFAQIPEGTLRTYYQLLNLAELSVTESKYPEALQQYQQAFSLHKPIAAKDIFNAALCAALSKKEKEKQDLLLQLAGKGVMLTSLKKDSITYPILFQGKSTQIHKLSEAYEKSYQQGLRQFNTPLRDSLTLLYDCDQHFRRMKDSYKVYGDTIKKIDIANDRLLYQLITRYGYPSEDMIGANQNMHPRLNFDIVIWHQTSLNFIRGYAPILAEAVKKGRIDPHRAAELIQNQSGNGDMYRTMILSRYVCEKGCSDSLVHYIKGKLFYSMLQKENTEKINKNREELFLESIDDYTKKVLFDLKDNRFAFYYVSGVPNFLFPNEEDLIHSLKNKKFIEDPSSGYIPRKSF